MTSRLYMLAKAGKLTLLKSEINKFNYDPESDGLTPLLVASHNGREGVVEFLLSNDNPKKNDVIRTINSRWDQTGKAALDQAARNGHTNIVKRLCEEKEVEYNVCKDGTTPLWIASQYGHEGVVEFLLSNDNPKKNDVMRTINSQWTRTGTTALHQAAKNGHTNIVKRLLDAKASPNIQNKDDRFPLECALRNKKFAAAACLLIYGANVNLAIQKLIIKYKSEITASIITVSQSDDFSAPEDIARCLNLLRNIGVILDGKQNPDGMLKTAFFQKRGLFFGDQPSTQDGKSCVAKLYSLYTSLQRKPLTDSKSEPEDDGDRKTAVPRAINTSI